MKKQQMTRQAEHIGETKVHKDAINGSEVFGRIIGHKYEGQHKVVFVQTTDGVKEVVRPLG